MPSHLSCRKSSSLRDQGAGLRCGYSGNCVQGSAKKWGTIRLGFSLKRAYRVIHETRRDLLWLSLGAIACGTLLAILLATRISRPVGYLVAAAQELAKGSDDRPVQVEAQDEIGSLARAFEHMRIALLRHLESELSRGENT